MSELFMGGRVELHCGDCITAMAAIPDNSIDSVVCDPPYGLEFMGKDWDGSDGFRRSLNAADISRGSMFGRQSARGPEYRTVGVGQVGAPGIGVGTQFRCEACGHLFHGGSRCQCAEPKPVRADNRWNLFQAWCQAWATECLRVLKPGGYLTAFGGTRTYHRLACGIEDAGFEIRDQAAWCYGTGFNKVGYIRDRDGLIVQEGWGGSLKPAWEPIALARKLPIGTVADNMIKFGTGALNIDGCRVSLDNEIGAERRDEESQDATYSECGATNFQAKPGRRIGSPGWGGPMKRLTSAPGQEGRLVPRTPPADGGRWPANLCHDGSDEVIAAFPEAPGQQRYVGPEHGDRPSRGIYGDFGARPPNEPRDDGGSAARFFYAAKADADDRIGSKHPTVKPVDLMRWLVRLVTPPNGTVLDCFAGTGTTGEAAYREGFKAILIEREAEYQADIRRRMALILAGPEERSRESIKARGLTADAGPLFAQVEAVST